MRQPTSGPEDGQREHGEEDFRGGGPSAGKFLAPLHIRHVIRERGGDVLHAIDERVLHELNGGFRRGNGADLGGAAQHPVGNLVTQ